MTQLTDHAAVRGYVSIIRTNLAAGDSLDAYALGLVAGVAATPHQTDAELRQHLNAVLAAVDLVRTGPATSAVVDDGKPVDETLSGQVTVYFSFGHGQTDPDTGKNLLDHYVTIVGPSYEACRAAMFASRYGERWAFDYLAGTEQADEWIPRWTEHERIALPADAKGAPECSAECEAQDPDEPHLDTCPARPNGGQ